MQHIDLEKHSCLLPVMPKNGIHYIGVDMKNPSIITNEKKLLIPFSQVKSSIFAKWKQNDTQRIS
jgi:hypothetical protein